MSMAVDWEKYLDIFPDRYISQGRFDKFVVDALSSLPPFINALDIGGGREGTLALKTEGVRCWLADPFIRSCPQWMISNLGKINNIFQKFDMIVARGSFNYLSPQEIAYIPRLLAKSGIFLFNTFAEPSSGERAYVNSRSRKTGTEKYNYDDGVIRHQLVPAGGEVVEHYFYFYDIKKIEAMLSLPVFVQRTGNSLHVKVVGEGV